MKKNLLFIPVMFCCVNLLAQTIPGYVPTNSLLGYWPLDGNANDLSTGAHHGTVNGPISTTDRFNVANKAYSFNGSNSDHISVPDHPSLSGFNDMSISVWVSFGQFSNIQNIVAKWYQALSCGSNSDTYLTATVDSSLFWNTNNHNVALQPNPPVFGLSKLNQWQHLVFTSSHTSGESIYVNGTLAATYNASIGSICASTNALVFGAGSNGTPSGLHRFLTGKLDDIGLWSRVLTPCEIASLYASSAPAANFTVSSSSTTLCAGSSATLMANSPGTYTWNGAPGANTLAINPTVTTTYTVTGPGTPDGCTGQTTFMQEVKICTGTGSYEEGAVVKLFPNPATDLLYIDLNSTSHSEFRIFITDLSGKIVLTRSIYGPNTSINTSRIEDGCYFITVQDNKGSKIRNAKLIIAH